MAADPVASQPWVKATARGAWNTVGDESGYISSLLKLKKEDQRLNELAEAAEARLKLKRRGVKVQEAALAAPFQEGTTAAHKSIVVDSLLEEESADPDLALYAQDSVDLEEDSQSETPVVDPHPGSSEEAYFRRASAVFTKGPSGRQGLSETEILHLVQKHKLHVPRLFEL